MRMWHRRAKEQSRTISYSSGMAPFSLPFPLAANITDCAVYYGADANVSCGKDYRLALMHGVLLLVYLPRLMAVDGWHAGAGGEEGGGGGT